MKTTIIYNGVEIQVTKVIQVHEMPLYDESGEKTICNRYLFEFEGTISDATNTPK